MSTVFRFVKEVDGKVAVSSVLSKQQVAWLLQGVYYARNKEYYEPRKKGYGVVYRKVWRVSKGVVE